MQAQEARGSATPLRPLIDTQDAKIRCAVAVTEEGSKFCACAGADAASVAASAASLIIRMKTP